MDLIMSFLGTVFGTVMRFWYHVIPNYGWSIILFTFTMKLVLLPLNIWLHKNSIKIIKLQAPINNIKADFFGDPSTIADKQAELYQKERYNPLANLIPLCIQIVLLMGLVEVIYHPFTYILQISPEITNAVVQQTISLMNLNPESGSLQLSVVSAVQSMQWNAEFTALFPSAEGQAALALIKGFQTQFMGFDICWIPSQMRGWLILAPLVAGFSSWLLCVYQNAQNVLQSEQGKANKWITMAISVGLSLYLGWFVPLGVALYWVIGNLYAILQTVCLNLAINPRHYVDYEALEESRRRLRELESLQQVQDKHEAKLLAKREKEAYKRFFSIGNKHLVFYSEKSGFYKYYRATIEYLLNHSNVVIHYVTNDPNDQIFEIAKENPQIKPYYIGLKRTITLMMKIDADIVVMTTPDLDNYYIKRSYVRKDIEYVYMTHGIGCMNMVTNRSAYDHFDSIFCVGQHQIDEVREMEEMYHTPAKHLIPAGFGMLDDVIAGYDKMEQHHNDKPIILIAPSWQKDNILDSCIDAMLESLLEKDYCIVVRPHPEYVKRYQDRTHSLIERWGSVAPDRLTIETDFSSNVTIYTADVLITDWSGIAYEFSFATLKRTLYVNTPMKILNPDFDKYKTKPFDLVIREKIGVTIMPDEAGKTADVVKGMLDSQESDIEVLRGIREQSIFNIGHGGEVTGQYLLKRLLQKTQGKEKSYEE